MPFESSTPLVVACVVGAVVVLLAGVRARSRGLLVVTALLASAGVGAFVADRLVETDREYLQELFPRLARAAERQDVAAIVAVLDPDLRPLRDEVERVLKQVRPTEVVITKLDVAVKPDTTPPEAVVKLIVRVTGTMIDTLSPGTALTGVKVLLSKKDGRWLVKDADGEPVRPGP